MATRRKHIEFDLPARLVQTIAETVGPGRISQLPSVDRANLMEAANSLARRVGEMLEKHDARQAGDADTDQEGDA